MQCVWSQTLHSPVLGVVIYPGAEGVDASALAQPGAHSSSASIPAHVVPALGRSSCTAALLWLSPTPLRGLQLGEFTLLLPLSPSLTFACWRCRPDPFLLWAQPCWASRAWILSCFALGVLVLTLLKFSSSPSDNEGPFR